MKKITFALTVALALMLSTATAQTGFRVLNTFHIPSPGGWDYIEVGPINNWLYVSHGTQVNVVNTKTGDSVGVIENTTGVHGIAFDVADNKGFTSNGRLNNVTVFDLKTNKVLGQVPTGSNPDAIMYEPFLKKIITCNGRSKNLSIIDPVHDKLVDSVDLGGKPETAVSDGNGKLYVNIEDKNAIIEVDLKSLKVINNWSIAPGEGPAGLAIDRVTKRLFSGCDKLLIVLDVTTGKVIDKLKIGDGCDGVVFDPATKNIFTSNGEGTITVIHEIDANNFKVMESIPTKRSARTIALDKTSHRLYLPAAEFQAPDENVKGRPKMKPGTFQVLEVGN